MYEHWVSTGRSANAMVKLLCVNPKSKHTSGCIKDSTVDVGSKFYREDFVNFELFQGI